jgi:hypothetical protein
MLSGKFTMARMPYSGRILGSKCHPYNWKKIFNPIQITYKIWPLSKWHICGQIPPVTLPGAAGNQPIRNSKLHWTVTCNIGNKQHLKGESGKAQIKTFSDGDTHLMVASLSKRDTLYRKNSKIFKRTASGLPFGNQNSGPKSLLSSGFFYRTRS